MSVVEFYHYTSESAAEAIISSGVIMESVDGGPDAHHGTGVYGTALPPSVGKKRIATNNYRQGWKNREKAGRVDYYIMVKLPRDKVEEIKTPKRHIYLHKGPIYLQKYEWECLEVSGKK